MKNKTLLIIIFISILQFSCGGIDVETKLSLARKAYTEKEYKETIKLLEDVSIEGLDKKIRFDVAYLLGKAQSNLGLYKASIIEFNYCIELDNYRDDLYNDRGYAYQQIGLYEESIADFNIAINKKPTDASYFNNRGFSQMQLSQMDIALSDFKNSVKYNPTYPYVYNSLGVALHKLGKMDSAYSMLSKAIELKPDYKEAYVNRAMLLMEAGEKEGALMDLEKCLYIDSLFYKANYLLGIIDLANNDTSNACVKLLKASNKGSSEIDLFYRQICK